MKFSASLVNNTSQDETPYVLVADHSIGTPVGGWGGTLPNTVFQFNYQTTTCSGSTLRTIVEYTGADILVRHSDTDLALLKLDNELSEADCDITLLGWSKSSSSPTSTTVLHHGGGNPMYISFGGIGTSTVSPSAGIYIWDVTLNSGIIEENSSGGPLLDQNRRVIGTVYGTYGLDFISCSNQDGKAYFGRLEKAWDGIDYGITGGVHIAAMKTFLDKNNTGVTTLNSLAVDNQPNYLNIEAYVGFPSSQGQGELSNCEYTYAEADYSGNLNIEAYEWNIPYSSDWYIEEEYGSPADWKYVEIDYFDNNPPSQEAIHIRAQNACGWSWWKEFWVDVDDCAGGYYAFSLSPNPVEEVLAVSFTSNEVSVSAESTQLTQTEKTNTSGVPVEVAIYDKNKSQILYRKGNTDENIELDVSTIPAGSYFIHVAIEGEKTQKKHLIIN